MRSRDGWEARAAIAAVALYGLLLSVFLGAMAPAAPFLPAGLLCRDGAASPAAPHAPVHRPDCCTLGCAAAAATAPNGMPAAAGPTLTWHAVEHDRARPTPVLARSPGLLPPPRGPPAA